MKTPCVVGEVPGGKITGGAAVESCALLTTSPNNLLRPIHDRMPVIVSQRDFDLWLSLEIQDPRELAFLFRPYPLEEMAAFPVQTAVNNPKTDAPGLTNPLPGNFSSGPMSPSST